MTPHNWLALIGLGILLSVYITKMVYEKRLAKLRALLDEMVEAAFQDEDPYARMERVGPIVGEMRKVLGKNDL